MSRPNERLVAIHDGSVVSNYSEEWRLECEAKYVMAMPSRSSRLDYLDRLAGRGFDRNGRRRMRRRPDEAIERLKQRVIAIREARKRGGVV